MAPADLSKMAVVLAAYGAANLEALDDILNVKKKIEAAFPGVPVKIGFGSRTVRRAWWKRRDDPAWALEHPEVPRDILDVKGPLATAADLEDQGFQPVVFQSLHIYAGEEYFNLKALVQALEGVRTVKPAGRPFPRLALGRPALGEPGAARDYRADLAEAADILAPEIEALPRDGTAALLYMWHGNRYFPTGIFQELEDLLRRRHPGAPIFLASLEGFPPLESTLAELRRQGIKRVVLAPLLLSVGSHARRDMAGDREGSWKSILLKNGFEVECLVRGLGRVDAWAEMYVRRLRDALADRGVWPRS
ncbi:MAG: sirohydrochlorin cobaltochelatase [Pseudomonadota bacterium]